MRDNDEGVGWVIQGLIDILSILALAGIVAAILFFGAA